jgi:hypothetical protein
MRPARIQVFDGLRIATEHVDHLQDALHSSIDDLREAIGLGKVIRGFEVERQEDRIVVHPGLGFDGRARRLALDEPLRVEAAIPPGREVQYVCLQHETVEGREVEGQPTLIWDTVAVSLQDVAPSAADDLLAVAKLVRTQAETPGFEVVAVGAEVPPGPEEPAPAAGEGAPPDAEPAPPSAETAPSETEPAAPEPAAPESAAPPQTEPAAPRAGVQQGVIRLPLVGAPAMDAIAALMTALGEQPNSDGPTEATFSIPLATAEVAQGMQVAAVTSTAHLAVTVSRADGTVGRLESVGRGEATLDEEGGRFGLSTVRSVPPLQETGGFWEATEFTEQGTATLPLAEASLDATTRELLRGLRLVTDVQAAAPDGVTLSCALAWSGSVDERRTEALKQEVTAVAWSAAIGWKALGR